ncbi:MAG: hypothetical protein C0621_08955 [Desulfuromonas sp.]|nr:MAG: hypothetical protein C0621_08955 [Desulfuromonas sp.]
MPMLWLKKSIDLILSPIPPKGSLRRKTILVLGGFSVGVFLVTVFWTYAYFRNHTVAQIVDRQQGLLADIISDIDNRLSVAHALIIETASTLSSHHQGFSDYEKAQEILAHHGEIQTLFNNGVVLFSAEGTLLADLPYSGREGSDFSLCDHILTTIYEDLPIVSDPYTCGKNHEPAIMLTSPIRDKNGKIVAILGGSIKLASLRVVGGAAQTHLGPQGYFYAISKDRQMILHPDRSRILKRDVPLGVNLLLDRAIRDGFSGSGETVNSRGMHQLASFGHSLATGWIVAVVNPTDAVYAPVIRFRNYYAVFVFVVLLVGTALANLVIRGITSNLEAFTEHLRRLPALPPAERPYRSEVNDETREMANAFNSLLYQIDQERKELALAKERAEAANQTKSQFISNISHELRTPMHGILGLTQICLETEMSEEQKEHLYGVLSSGRSLLSLLNDLLDIAKIESGHVSIERSHFHLRHLFRDSLKTFTPAANNKGIGLTLEIPDQIPDLLYGDPSRLRQVLVNLLGNALKFSDKGEVKVRAQLLEENRDQVVLRFEVSDEGIGIPEALLEKIFEPFEQGEGEMTRRFGGTGLGLAICRQLLGLMDSRMEVVSETGKGSSFFFNVSFPVMKVDLTEWPKEELPQEGGRAIIVADKDFDDEKSRRLLESMGLKTVVIPGLRMKEELLRQSRLDLLLLTASLPADDLWALAREARLFCGHKTLIVVVPAVGAVGDAERCGKLQLNGYLPRPFETEDLKTFIYYLFGQKKRFEDGTRLLPVTRHEVEEIQDQITVLVVEDVEINRKIATTLLQRDGHRIRQAINGQEAIECWQHGGVDLILMDIQMPILDGLEATRQIRQFESEQKTPPVLIAAVTAGATLAEEESCYAVGMDAYLTKPFDLTKLRELLQRAVEKKGRR